MFGFAFPDRTNLLAGLLSIPLIENVVEWHHLQTGFGGGIHILLNRDKGYTEGRIDDLCQPSHFHLLTTKAAEVFHNNRADQAVLYHLLHLLKAFPLKGSTGYAVVYKELRVPIAFPAGEVRENLFLIRNGVRLHILVIVIHGQPTIQCRNEFILLPFDFVCCCHNKMLLSDNRA